MAWMGWLSGPSFYLGPFSSVLGQSGPAPARAHACRPTSPRDPATCSCTGSIITKRLSCPLMLPLSPPKQRPSRTRDAVIRSYRTTHIWIQTTVSYKPMEPVSNNTTKGTISNNDFTRDIHIATESYLPLTIYKYTYLAGQKKWESTKLHVVMRQHW